VTLLRRLEESHANPAALSVDAPDNIRGRVAEGSPPIARF
jgi:hypothetical protein